MERHARHERLVRHLRRNGSATVGELARDVGVSRRTVLRDIGALREQGYLLHGDAGRGGGVRLDPGSVQTSARLTVDEVFALLMSVAMMRASGTMPFFGLADAGLAKIERSLPPDRVRDFRAILDCLHVGQLSPHQPLDDVGPMDPDLLASFERAFLRRLHMRFHYRDAKGRRTVREVEPQAMLVLPPLWYLVAWDPSRAGFRHFRMDRIVRPRALEGTTFRRRRVPFEEDVCPFTQRFGARP